MLVSRPVLRRVAGATAAALAVGIVPFVAAAPTASAAPTELFISEYVEGSSNNKALEIYNGTGAAGRPRAGGLQRPDLLQRRRPPRPTDRPHRHGRRGRRLRLRHSSAAAPRSSRQADQTSGSASWNGDDAVVLRKGTHRHRRHRPDRLRPRHRVGHRPHLDGRQHPPPQGVGPGRRHQRRRRLRPLRRVGRLRHRHLRRPGRAHGRRRPVDRRRSDRRVDLPGRRAAPPWPPDANVTVTFSEPVDGPRRRVRPRLLGERRQGLRAHRRSDHLHPRPDDRLRHRRRVHAHGERRRGHRRRRQRPAGHDGGRRRRALLDPGRSTRARRPSRRSPPSRAAAPTVAITRRGDDPWCRRRRLRGRVARPCAASTSRTPTGDGDPATSDGIFVFEVSNADAVKLGDVVTVTGTAGENQGQSQISAGTAESPSAAPARSPRPTSSSRSPARPSSSGSRACSSSCRRR